MTQTWDELRYGDVTLRKLTFAQAEDIRRRYAAGDIGRARLGREFGVSELAIRRITNGTHYITPDQRIAGSATVSVLPRNSGSPGMTLTTWLSQRGRTSHRDPRDRTTNRWRYGSYRPAYIWDDDNTDDPALAA